MSEEVSAVDPITGEPLPSDNDSPSSDERRNANTPETATDKSTGLEKALKDTQKAFHESRQEIAALKERLARNDGRLEEISKTKQDDKPEGYFDFLDKEAAESDVTNLFEDPKNADRHVKQLLKRGLAPITSILDGMRAELLQAVKTEIGKATTTEAPEVRRIVDELKQDEDFKTLDDGVLEVLARKRLKATTKATGTTYRGSPGSSQVQRSSGSSDLERLAAMLEKQNFPSYSGEK